MVSGRIIHQSLITAGASLALTLATSIVLATAEFFNNALPVIAEDNDSEDENTVKLEEALLKQSYKKITHQLVQEYPEYKIILPNASAKSNPNPNQNKHYPLNQPEVNHQPQNQMAGLPVIPDNVSNGLKPC